MNIKLKVIRLTSENFKNSLLTYPAYKEVVKHMNSKDRHTHKVAIELVNSYPDDIVSVGDLDFNEPMGDDYFHIYGK